MRITLPFSVEIWAIIQIFGTIKSIVHIREWSERFALRIIPILAFKRKIFHLLIFPWVDFFKVSKWLSNHISRLDSISISAKKVVFGSCHLEDQNVIFFVKSTPFLKSFVKLDKTKFGHFNFAKTYISKHTVVGELSKFTFTDKNFVKSIIYRYIHIFFDKMLLLRNFCHCANLRGWRNFCCKSNSEFPYIHTVTSRFFNKINKIFLYPLTIHSYEAFLLDLWTYLCMYCK